MNIPRGEVQDLAEKLIRLKYPKYELAFQPLRDMIYDLKDKIETYLIWWLHDHDIGIEEDNGDYS